LSEKRIPVVRRRGDQNLLRHRRKLQRRIVQQHAQPLLPEPDVPMAYATAAFFAATAFGL
jgi:hypothetical protein